MISNDIEVDWKIKVYTESGEWVGTDQIEYWLCDAGNVKSLVHELKSWTDQEEH